MKKTILKFFLLVGLTGNVVVAQTDYYWYKGQKVPLTKNESKKFVLYGSATNERQASDLFSKINARVSNKGTNSLPASVIPFKGAKKDNGNWAIVQSDASIATTTSLDGVIYEAPFYVSNDKIEAGLSNLFYVKLKSASDIKVLEKLALKNGAQILGNNKFMPEWYTLSVSKTSKGNALELSNLFYESGLFSETGPDFIHGNIEAACPSDALFTSQWNLNNTGQAGGTVGVDINACDAWNVTTGNTGVIVAVLDHGIQLNHPDITNLVSQSYDTPTGTSPSIIRGNHGTACAGIIGAARNTIGVSGIAPGARLMSISDPLFTGPNAAQQLADGINFAWNNGAAIISNSWGHAQLASPILDNAITNALTLGRGGKGTIVVFATANSNGAVSYPANSNPNILAVGATNPCGTRKAPFTCEGEGWGGNFGAELDVMAPGVLIPTTDLTGANGYSSTDYAPTFNGTSAATPHVAGVAALILSINPNLTRLEVANIIESTAQKTGGYAYATTSGRPNGTWHQETGYGFLDAKAAVLKAQTTLSNYLTKFSVPRPTALPTFFKKSGFVHVLGTGGPNLSGIHNSIFNWNLSNNQLVQFTLERNSSPWFTELASFSTNTFSQAQPKIVINGNTGYTGLAGTYFVNIHNNNPVLVAQSGQFAIYFSTSSTPPNVRVEDLAESVESDDQFAVRAYPNPFASQTTVNLNGGGSVVVTDARGQLVEQIEGIETVTIGANYKTGLYLVKVVSGPKVETFSIIKE